jgi:drug/metabolite transporter (DMT)-like permease
MIEIFLVYALLASAITANKALLISLPPLFFVGMRMLFAGLILLGLSYARKQKIQWQSVKKDFHIFLLITLFNTLAPAILKAYALKHMPSSEAALCGTLDPFITALYSYFLWQEKLSVYNWLGMAVGFFGVSFLILSSATPELSVTFFQFFSYPALAAVLAVALVRYGWILVQTLVKSNRYTPSHVNTITMLGSGVLSSLGSLCIESFSSLSIPYNYSFLGLTLYTVIIGNVISLTFYATLLKYYSSTFLSVAGFSVPLFVAFFGWLYLNETISSNFFISLISLFAGLLLFHYETVAQQFKKRLILKPLP